MERRNQPQVDVVHTVRVTVLDEPPVKLEGQVVNISGGGFRIQTNGRIRLEAAVRIDMADAVLLGEVCYCCEEGEGRFAVGLESQQILSHTRDLARLMQSLNGPSGKESEVNPKPRHGILADG